MSLESATGSVLLRPLVLLVDDDPAVLDALQALLAPRLEPWYEVEVASTAEEALELVDHRPIALVISDERMPGRSGTDLLVALRDHAAHRHGGRILLTGYAGLASAERAINDAEVDRYFPKPWDAPRSLLPAVGEVLARFAMRTGLDRYFLVGPPAETDRAAVARVRRAWLRYLTLCEIEDGADSPEDDGAVLFLARRMSPEEDVPAGAIRLRAGEPGRPWVLDRLAIDPEEAGDDLKPLLVQTATVHAACAGASAVEAQVPTTERAIYTSLGFRMRLSESGSTGPDGISMHLRIAELRVPAAYVERYRRESRLCRCVQAACPAHDYAAERRGYLCPLDLEERRTPPGYPVGPRG